MFWEINPNGQPRTIWDAYKNPSRAKENIYKAWAYWFDADKFDFRIVSHNSQFFSIAVRVGRILYYITPRNKYMIRLSDDILALVNDYKSYSLFRGL